MGKLSYLYVLAGFLFVCTTAEAQEPEEINIKKELMITDLSVVNDARADGPDGPWSFGGLMTRMAPSDAAAPQFVKDWLDTWRKGGSVNGFALDKRAAIDTRVIGPWMEKDGETSFENWKPNFANAPFRLLAVVYRPDILKKNEAGDFLNSGEGRFVFVVLDKDGNPQRFTVIFEYDLVGTDRADLKAWAERWHALGPLEFGADYNEALQLITDLFSGRDSDPRRPNGNALAQIRTNEVALGGPWQLREFNISENGKLENVTVKQTPHNSFRDKNDGATISAFVNENAAAIKKRDFNVPESFQGAPLIGGTSEVPPGFIWPLHQIEDKAARHAFSMMTCNGCHHKESGPKPDGALGFLHIGGRAKEQEAKLSVFLSGGAPVEDEFDPPTKRSFDDLAERQKALVQALNPRISILARSLAADDLSVAASRQSRPH
jgi:hypothetical protein